MPYLERAPWAVLVPSLALVLMSILAVSLSGLWRGREAGGALGVSWVRRTRIGGDSWDGIEVPLGEETERYLVRVTRDGTTLLETLTQVPEWSYPAAQIAAVSELSISGQMKSPGFISGIPRNPERAFASA